MANGTINIRVKPQLLNEFKILCEKQGLTYSEVIKFMMAEYIEQHKQKSPAK